MSDIEDSYEEIELTVVFKNNPITRTLPSDLPFETFQELIFEESSVPIAGQKLFAPKTGLIKVDKLSEGSNTPISVVFPTPQSRKRILLMGTPEPEMLKVKEAEIMYGQQLAVNERIKAARAAHRRKKNATLSSSPSTQSQHLPSVHTLSGPSSQPQPKRQATQNNMIRTLSDLHGPLGLPGLSPGSPAAGDDDTPKTEYTFHKLVPLPFLPHPNKSRELLRQLRDDRGIMAIMKKYKWSIPVLTELDPTMNTASNVEGTTRLLGLNRNKGQVIELRLRTDAYDGWLKFKDVRKVLCHELTHNVFGDHDDNFWNFCHKLEKEVIELDPFGRQGKSIVSRDIYTGPRMKSFDEDDEGEEEEDMYDYDGAYDDHHRLLCDGGGYIGSTHILGASPSEREMQKIEGDEREGDDEMRKEDVKAMLRQAALERERRRETMRVPPNSSKDTPSPSPNSDEPGPSKGKGSPSSPM